jgi:hypothetical protein
LANRIPARLSPREGRRFALTLAPAFLVLAGILYWRGGIIVAAGLAAVAGALLLAGVLIPGRLGPVHRAWMAFAVAISHVTTPIVVSLIFFLVILPSGLLTRLFGHRPLVHDDRKGGYWVSRPVNARCSDLRRQF